MKDKKPNVDDFIREFILTGCKDGTQACINAGYSEKTAPQQASRLLKNVKVLTVIEQQKKVKTKLFIKTKEDKLLILEKVMKKCGIDCPDKGMLNANAVIAAVKEHNLMQGDNAPTEIINDNTEIKEIKITVVKGND